MIIKLISSCFFVYFILFGKWNLAQSIDSSLSISSVTHSDISLQDPDYSSSGAHTHSAPTFSSVPNGGVTLSHTSSPVLTSAVPTAGAQVVTHVAPGTQAMAASVTYVNQQVAAPIAGAHVATPASPGAPIAGSHVTHGAQVADPVSNGAQVASPVYNGTQHVATPGTSGSQPVVTHVAPGTQATATVMMPGSHVASGSQAITDPTMTGSHIVTPPATTGTPIAGSPVGQGAQVASSVTHSAPVAQSFSMPTAQDPTAGAPVAMTSPIAGTSVAMGTPIAGAPVTSTTPTPGSQVASPVTHDTHVAPPSSVPPFPTSDTIPIPSDPNGHFVPASFTPISEVVAIPVETGESSKPPTKQLQKIHIEINDRQDSQFIKYRWNDEKEMDIYFAKDGYIINEIHMNGNKRWPQPNEVKECKKVLYYTNPDNGRKTLKVIYDDEPEAYDPDHPPKTTTIPSQDFTPSTLEADTFSHSAGSPTSPGIIPQSQINLPPPQVASQQTLTPPSPLSIDSSRSIGESSHSNYQTSDFKPVHSASATLDSHVNLEPSSSSVSSDPTGWTVPLETDKAVSEVYFDQTHIDNDVTSSLFAAAEIDHGSQQFSSPQLIKTSSSGQRYVDIKMDPDELDDDQPHHGFQVEEVRGYDPDDDDGYERIPLTQYVTDLGYRVGHLENRMDSADDTIKLLVRALDYQHDIIEFRRRLGAKTAPFGADLGRQAFFDPEAFRPASSQVSKVLDPTEHPSDIKLFVLDSTDVSKHVELGNDKFTVNQEGDEFQYVFDSSVECKLVTFNDRTVWNHRSTDPHPLGVDYFSEDDKVVVDFEDAIVMFVKKGDLTGSSPINIDLTEEVDSVTTDINSSTIATGVNDSVSIESQSSQ